MMLSVIIPVYRVEQTLERCVNSVLAQGLDNLEVILVDDGSPDTSGIICDKIASGNPCVKVIHQTNSGLSGARNTGLNAAIGEYVTFVDSDDYLSENTYRPLMDIIAEHPEYDILEYPVMVYLGSPKEHRLSFTERVYSDVTEYWLSGRAYAHAYAWNKIYRRALFDTVQFPVGKVFEDVYTLPKLLHKAKCIATVGVGLYNYCWNTAGITATANGKDLSCLLAAHVNVINSIKESYKHSSDFVSYYMHVLNIQSDVCRLTKASATLPRYRFSIVKTFACLVKTDGWLVAVKFLIYACFGIAGLCVYSRLKFKIQS